ncbi:MAG: TetR/AcrR family transcriptional regulator [Myxococcota bacterium]|nr:TetR/AcrR family transcriptional regulator [Myxococcota bacterium]
MTKGEETRLRILDTALELFWKRSFHGVNTAEICEASGVNKATLYRHFPSKTALAVAAVERGRDRTREFVFEGAFAESDDPARRLRAIYDRVQGSHRDLCNRKEPSPGCPFVNLGMELGTQIPEVLSAVNEAFASFRPYYRRIIRDLNADPEREPLDVSTSVEALLQVMNAGMVASKLKNDPREIRRARGIAERIAEL